MKRVRDFIEKVLYAGMKPGAPAVAPNADGLRWLGSLRGPVDRFLSGGPSPSDPLYLSRRTTTQKVLRACAIGIPFAVMVTVLFLAASGRFNSRPPQLAAALLPDYKDVQLQLKRDLVVVDARLNREASPVTLSGSVKNVTDHKVRSADIVFELTDKSGSQVGGYTVTVENIGAMETVHFSAKLQVSDVVSALVRDVISR